MLLLIGHVRQHLSLLFLLVGQGFHHVLCMLYVLLLDEHLVVVLRLRLRQLLDAL